MEIGAYVRFVHSVNIKGQKKILPGEIKEILKENFLLIEVVNYPPYNGMLCNRSIADIIAREED